MSNNLALDFSLTDQAVIIMPAGCGKTELIAKSVSYSSNTDKRQLILTHTHAGVKSIYDRLKKFGVPQKNYFIDTIDGFSLQYTSAFPINSGLGYGFDPSSNEWDKVRNSATEIFSQNCAKRIINASYCGLYVDEYQDCSLTQHQIILELAKLLPTRIVGDPLQGIFDFGNNRIVNWYTDVFPNFERLEKDNKWIPYRWLNKNEGLGQWLFEIREIIKREGTINLANVPNGVSWKFKTPSNQKAACKAKLNTAETAVAIHHLPNQAHRFAHDLGGSYLSMDETESKELYSWLDKFEISQGTDRIIAVIDFACACFVNVSTNLKPFKNMFTTGTFTITERNKNYPLFTELSRINQSSDWKFVLASLKLIASMADAKLFRGDLWFGFYRVIYEKVLTGTDSSFDQIAWSLKINEKIYGRKLAKHLVSRTLLIKGLEFDHAIILDADVLNAKELYVAMTRGTKSLTILSSSQSIKKNLPGDLFPPKNNQR